MKYIFVFMLVGIIGCIGPTETSLTDSDDVNVDTDVVGSCSICCTLAGMTNCGTFALTRIQCAVSADQADECTWTWH